MNRAIYAIMTSLILVAATLMITLPTQDAFALQEIDACGVLNQSGETYVLTGDIVQLTNSDCIIIQADNVTLDCKNHSITGPGNAGEYHGIRVSNVYGATVVNCDVEGFGHAGIRVDGGGNHLIENNISSNNYYRGMSIVSSNGNMISHNLVSDNVNVWGGIQLANSDYNTIVQNTIQNNPANIRIVADSDSNKIVGNMIDGGGTGILISNDGSNIPNDNNVVNNEVTGTINGIYIIGTDHNTIVNNQSYENQYGIRIQSSDNNDFTNNSANDNSSFGFYETSSTDNSFKNNKCSNNGDDSNPDELCK